MGVQTWILMSDPIITHEVMASSMDRAYTTFGHKYYSHGGKGVAFSNYTGNYWKKARSAVLSVLAPKMVDQYVDLIEREASCLTDRLIEETKKSGNIDAWLTVELYSFNIISQVCLGKQFKSIEDEDFLKLSKILKKGVKQTKFARDLPNFLPGFWIINKIMGVEAEMAHYVDAERDPYVRELISKAVMTDGPNIMKALGDENFSLDEENKLIIFTDSLTAGSDTTATTLYWAIGILCSRPDIQKKIQDEIDMFFRENSRLPTFSDHDKMNYCVSVIKEVLRYKPVTPFGLPHLANKDIFVGEYYIPKGSVVVSSMDHMHRNPKVYDRPLDFMPERFMNNTKTMNSISNGNVEGRDQYNFGWGRRMCPGMYLSEAEILSAYISIFSRCSIEPDIDSEGNICLPDISLPVDSGITQIAKPFKVRFIERANRLV
ncbi:cytochrome P450 [Backusella circina FSU 941]|nr:cytochrome P450 [Backusella circina FSU 941]